MSIDLNFFYEQKPSLENISESANEYDSIKYPFNFPLYSPNDYNKLSEILEKNIIKIRSNENFKNNKNPTSGRKRKNPLKEEQKYHDKYAYDNILKRLNVHFLNFIIIFVNEILSKCNLLNKSKDEKFYDINGGYKKTLNKNEFYNLRKKTIAQILILENNKKFSNKNRNKELLNRIMKNNHTILKKILFKRYIDIFKEVYYQNKKDIIYEGLSIKLNIIFDDFLEKVNAKEDILYKKRIDEVIKRYYFPKIFNIINYFYN